MDPNINQQIAQSLGINDLPANDQQTVISQLSEIAIKKILIETIKRLGEEDLKKLTKLIEENKQDAVMNFIKKSIPDYDNFISSTIRKVIDEFKQTIAETK